MKLLILTGLSGLMLASCIRSAVNADEDCFADRLNLLSSYYAELKSEEGNTAQFFNLKYLAGEMKSNGVGENELPGRLLGYLTEIDERQASIDMLSAYATCSGGESFVVLKGIDKQSEADGQNFFIVSFKDARITNFSEEAPNAMFNGRRLNDLGFRSTQ